MLIDSHCHIDLLLANDNTQNAAEVVQRAADNDVGYLLNVCVSLAQFPNVLDLANQFENVAASIGVHPNEQHEQPTLDMLITQGQHKKVIAVGETGLDYYRSQGNLTWQQERFALHIVAAKQLQKPLIIHTRAAKDDTLAMMKSEHAQDISGIMHCFSEDIATAKMALDLGFYISFSGIVTFKNATDLQAVAKYVPLNRLLIETDSPYLAPVPYRGKPNEPAYVKYTAEFIAQLRKLDYETFAEQTTQNFFALFPGAKPPHV